MSLIIITIINISSPFPFTLSAFECAELLVNFLFIHALMCGFEVRKISVIHIGTFEGTFSTQQCATSYFSVIFQLILHFP